MRQLMLQHSRQLGRNGIEAADWNAQLAIVEGSCPGRSTRNVKERLLGVKRYDDIVTGRTPKIAREIVVVRFQSGQDLSSECFRALLALIMQDEVVGFALREVGLDILLALRFCQEFLHCGIGAQFDRALPRSNRIFGAVRSLLGITEYRIRI